MGVLTEAWYQRIGLHSGGTFTDLQSSDLFLSRLPTGRLSATHLFLIICMLLVIGNIELNPGPQDFLKACSTCGAQFRTAKQHIEHQKLHVNRFNFKYECPYPFCSSCFDGFKSLNAHISHHSKGRDEVVGESVSNFKCLYCDEEVTSNKEYCQHLKSHLNAGLRIQCPFHFDNCSRIEDISSTQVFKVHLSQCHPGWRKDYSATALTYDRVATEPHAEFHGTYPEREDGAADSQEDDETQEDNNTSSDTDSSSESAYRTYGPGVFDHAQIIQYFGNFYAMLEGAYLVPESTVDVIAQSLSFISEILQDKLKSDLSRSLASIGLPEETRARVIEAAVSMDPFYNVHHNNAPAECFLTGDRRRTYYKNNFKHQSVVEINLRKNPYDASHFLHYIDIRDIDIQKTGPYYAFYPF